MRYSYREGGNKVYILYLWIKKKNKEKLKNDYNFFGDFINIFAKLMKSPFNFI